MVRTQKEWDFRFASLSLQIRNNMQTNENFNDSNIDTTEKKKLSGAWPFFLIMGGFIALLLLIKLFV
jgi:hypothetical protein